VAALRDDGITRWYKQVIERRQVVRNAITGSEKVNLRLKLTDAMQNEKALAEIRVAQVCCILG